MAAFSLLPDSSFASDSDSGFSFSVRVRGRGDLCHWQNGRFRRGSAHKAEVMGRTRLSANSDRLYIFGSDFSLVKRPAGWAASR